MISKIMLGSMADIDRPRLRQLSFNSGNIYITVIRTLGIYSLLIHKLDREMKEYKQFSLIVDHRVSPRQLNENFLIINSWNKIYIFDIQKLEFDEVQDQNIYDGEDDWSSQYKGTQKFKLNDNKLMVTELSNYPLKEEYIFSDQVNRLDFTKYGKFESISIINQQNSVQSFLLPLNKNQTFSQRLRLEENTFFLLAGWPRILEFKIRYTVRYKQALLLDVDESDLMQVDNEIIALSFFDYYVKILCLSVKKIVRKFKKSNSINSVSITLKHYIIERQIGRKETKIYNIITGRVITRAETLILIDDNIIVEREEAKLIVSKLVIEDSK